MRRTHVGSNGDVDQALRSLLGLPLGDVQLVHSTDDIVFDGCRQAVLIRLCGNHVFSWITYA